MGPSFCHGSQATGNWPQKVRERCESGRIGVTANDLTGETRSVGSNPTLSASMELEKFFMAMGPEEDL